MAKRETKLTLADIQKSAEVVNTKQKFYIDKDQEKFIYYYPKFSKRKITILINDLSHTMSYVEQHKLDFFNNDDELHHYILFLMIKHFTDLQAELKDKSIETHFATMHQLVDIGWYELFLMDMFTIAEVSNALAEISKRLNLSIKYVELEKELQQQLQTGNTPT
ncbi:hypothetical protein I6G82_11385 [Lysinibacillus macroides]|uniref:Uncharacterized protein n=1 Tax=Lysinibacillus macroides TaxID=33935 RepID=A0A0N0CWF0_9BACI|nr:hypothetical protein [Lysinibacillus macroides]KOY83024.1 hypothetical protein ADM90_06870 [Lysinibacillus macroides]QPR70123.1 hypothetical protein I6G82_11385 [Lysinibacillus macroides]